MIKKRKQVVFSISIIVIIIVLIALNIIIRKETTSDISSNNEITKIITKKILYVASYNIKNPWSSRIKSGIEKVLKPHKNIQLKYISMDTMGEKSEKKIINAALKAKRIINSWKPDIVITSDDNAAKYLIVPYFTDSELPFVFCGINWDATKYGFPSKNVTGILEVQLVKQLVKYLVPYAKGTRIGSIRGNTITNRAEAKFFEKQIGKEIKTYFVDNISDWKNKFIKLQNEVDIILIGDIDTVKLNGESKKTVEDFIFKNTKIPTGHWDSWFKNNALVTLATVPEEQGEYSAKTAIKILQGQSPSDIPLTENKEATIFLNMKLAKKLGIVFPVSLVENANLVAAE